MKTFLILFIAAMVGGTSSAVAKEDADQLATGFFSTAYRNATVYVGARTNDALADIVIFELPKAKEGEPQKEIRAKSGMIVRRTAAQVDITLTDVRIDIKRAIAADGKTNLTLDSSETRPTLDFTLFRN